MNPFAFFLASKIIYGEGESDKLAELCQQHGFKKLFIVTGRTATKNSPYFQTALQRLQASGVQIKILADVEADPCVETIDQGAAALKEFQADAVLAFGGGSPMDAAKAMNMLSVHGGSIREYIRGKKTITQRGLPLICIPTTAGTGSEVTAAAVTTDRQTQEKIGLSHEFMMPFLAIVDPLLHVSMPPEVTAATGIDALTHAIEAFLSRKANPLTDALALQAIKMIGNSLRPAYHNGHDLEIRSQMALASLIAGAAFTHAGLGAVHGIAHPVGAQFGVSHGQANGIILPYVLDYYQQAGCPKLKDIAAALGENIQELSAAAAEQRAVAAIHALKKDLAVPDTLSAVGIEANSLESIAGGAATYRSLPNSPRNLAIEDLRIIIAAAIGN